MTQPFRSAPRRARRRARRTEELGGEPAAAAPVRRERRPDRRNPPPRRAPISSGLIAAIVVLGLGVVVASVVFLGNGGGTASPSPGGTAAANGVDCPSSQPAALPAGQTRTVTIATAKGNIVIQVKADLSPIATGNFVALAACKFYDGLVFHRVVPDFVIQGGDPNGDGSGGPGYKIQDEPVTGTYARGTVAMARTTDANSQGSQFFIVLSDDAATSLTAVQAGRGYAILGTVVSGMDVVDAIATAADQEKPTNPVAMTTVTVTNP